MAGASPPSHISSNRRRATAGSERNGTAKSSPHGNAATGGKQDSVPPAPLQQSSPAVVINVNHGPQPSTAWGPGPMEMKAWSHQPQINTVRSNDKDKAHASPRPSVQGSWHGSRRSSNGSVASEGPKDSNSYTKGWDTWDAPKSPPHDDKFGRGDGGNQENAHRCRSCGHDLGKSGWNDDPHRNIHNDGGWENPHNDGDNWNADAHEENADAEWSSPNQPKNDDTQNWGWPDPPNVPNAPPPVNNDWDNVRNDHADTHNRTTGGPAEDPYHWNPPSGRSRAGTLGSRKSEHKDRFC